MLSWLCVLAKPLGTHAKASLPCSPLPLHQSLLFPLIFAKEHLSLALLAPPVTPSLSIPTTFSKAHQPLRSAPRPCLPSKKVRCCHPKKFGRLPEGLLPIRTINEIFRTIPRKSPSPLPFNERSVGFVSALSLAPHHILASLVKGELLLPEKNSGDYRRDCSLSAPSMRFSAVSPALNLPPLSKEGGLTARHKP